eukprot:2904417-Alexandrium_andersonii.AAC.1
MEVDLKAPPGAAPASLVRGCVRMDHVRSRPICKHAGAVSYALAAESRDKAKQFPALPASRA